MNFDETKNSTVWHGEALQIYGAGNNVRATWKILRQKYEISCLTIREFFRSLNVLRTKEEIQQIKAEKMKLKRWARQCVKCQIKFDARTPTANFCATCI